MKLKVPVRFDEVAAVRWWSVLGHRVFDIVSLFVQNRTLKVTITTHKHVYMRKREHKKSAITNETKLRVFRATRVFTLLIETVSIRVSQEESFMLF